MVEMQEKWALLRLAKSLKSAYMSIACSFSGGSSEIQLVQTGG
jgi:hypothetical protein